MLAEESDFGVGEWGMRKTFHTENLPMTLERMLEPLIVKFRLGYTCGWVERIFLAVARIE